MSVLPAKQSLSPPTFVPEHRQGLADFWTVYDANYDAIQRATLALATSHPEFRHLVRSTHPEQSAAQSARTRELLRRALMEGEWDAYLVGLRAQGAAYAKIGVTFAAWYDIVRAFQLQIVPLLVAQYGQTPPRMTAAIMAMLELIHYAMATIGQEYVTAKEEVLALRESKAAAERSNRFLDSIVENIPNMIFVKEGKELRFERLNRAGEELLGVARASLIGKNDFDFFPREQAEFFQQRDRETLQGKVVVDIAEEPIETARGERWLHTKKVPVLDEDGTPVYLLGISEDITELRRSAEALRRAKEAAEEANRELESFSYSVAHDLRAPLRGINGFSRALLDDHAGRLDEEGRDFLARIAAGAQRMGHLIDALLALSRVTRTELRRERVDLSKLAASVATQLQAAQPGHVVDFTCRPGMVARGDARLLQALLENLLGNAWKFTSGRPSARVTFGYDDASEPPAYYVEDDGAGFDMAYADRLFAPFQRLHTVSQFEGTGIGLANAKRIVTRHGGRIWAEGAVGRGAKFCFTLPPIEG